MYRLSVQAQCTGSVGYVQSSVSGVFSANCTLHGVHCAVHCAAGSRVCVVHCTVLCRVCLVHCTVLQQCIIEVHQNVKLFFSRVTVFHDQQF